jgi:hypothetical protein
MLDDVIRKRRQDHGRLAREIHGGGSLHCITNTNINYYRERKFQVSCSEKGKTEETELKLTIIRKK